MAGGPANNGSASPLSREGARQAVQKWGDLAVDLKDRAQATAGQVQRVASDKVVSPVAKRVKAAKASAEKARVSAFRQVYYVTGCVWGVVAWTVGETLQQLKTKGVRVWAVDTVRATPGKVRAAANAAQVKARQLAVKAREIASDKSFQATAASAVGGGAALGTTGGVVGAATGTVVGAIVGLPAALFTFGLSIPVTAAIGGTCGLVTGAAAGGTVGAVGAGAAGYGAYQKRDQISNAVSSGRQRVRDVASLAKEKAGASADYVSERAAVVRTKLSGRDRSPNASH